MNVRREKVFMAFLAAHRQLKIGITILFSLPQRQIDKVA